MTSAGKWVLGLLLLVVGAVFVARTVSSDPGGSAATVKNNLPGAAVAGAAKDAKSAAAVEAAAKKKIASTIAGDLSCKKACVEVNEVAADSITTAKLAPGSVTLSKLAFEVPNLNELENEINARKAAEASVKAAQAEAAAAGAKNDAAITAAASNGITQEAAARTAADEDLAKKTAAADADLLSKLNIEVKDRGDADNVLQGKLNTEIADRAGAINNLRSELGNGNQVAAPIIQINNNEIVGDAVTSNKILAETILAEDLATGSVTTSEILNDTVAAIDLADGAVIGRAIPGDLALTNVKAETLRGERTANGSAAESTGDLAIGTITGENNNLTPSENKATGNIGLETVGRSNLVDNAVDNSKLELDAVTTDRILNGEVQTDDIADQDVTTSKLAGSDIDELGLGETRAVTARTLADGAVINRALGENSVTTDKIASNTIRGEDVSITDGTNLRGNNIGRETVTGEGDNDGAGPDGNLALATVGRRNLVLLAVDTAQLAAGAVTLDKLAAQSVDSSKLTSAFLTSLVTESEFTARLSDVSATATSAGAPPLPQPNNADSVVDWSKLKNVPGGFADNVDEDGSGSLNTFKNDLKADDSTPDQGSDPVSFSKIKDLTTGPDGNITSDFVRNGSLKGVDLTTVDGDGITGSNVKNGSLSGADITAVNADGLTGLNIKDGSIGVDDLGLNSVRGRALGGAEHEIQQGSISGEGAPTAGATGDIALGTITAANLAPAAALDNLAPDSVTGAKIANGTVTTRELLANANSVVLVGGATAASVDFGVTGPGPIVPVLTNLDTVAHKVLLSGQAVFTCACDDDDIATVTWQLVDSSPASTDVAAPVGPVYTSKATAASPIISMPYSFVQDAAGAGEHHYKLRVTFAGAGTTPPTGLVDTVVINAVDLGRAA